MQNVLLLGASGLLGPHLLEALEPCCHLTLADVKPHPMGRPIVPVDVTCYEQVADAARGMDAIMNFTVLRHDPVQSFEVNVKGAFHVMKAAAAHGIRKVIHTGPILAVRSYEHDWDLDSVPARPGTDCYWLTKFLSNEICRAYSRTFGIQTICFLFSALGARPTAVGSCKDLPACMLILDDLAEACRLALEVPSVPGGYQAFILHSFPVHGRHPLERARRILGYEPRDPDPAWGRRA